jgi:diguanylate cyclase (GGDEF)-like protein
VDIDHFKQLNDAHGHRAGDEVLQRVAALIHGNVRKVDLLARYGGEEFMVLLPQVTKDEALVAAEKLRRLVAETPDEYGPGQPLGHVSISVGVANLPVDAAEQEALVDCADSALYAAKRAGRDKAIAYAAGMELHPGRQRGPHAERRKSQDGAASEPPTPRAVEG